MGQRLTTASVAVTSGATLILGANNDSQLRAFSVVTGPVWIGTAGVTTTGATQGYPVSATIPFIMPGGDERHAGVFVGAMWAIATNTASSINVMEIST